MLEVISTVAITATTILASECRLLGNTLKEAIRHPLSVSYFDKHGRLIRLAPYTWKRGKNARELSTPE